jgi:anti-sigma factor RsiW
MDEIRLSCDEAGRAIARWSDDDEALDSAARARLDAHVRTCADCRAALDTQRNVAAWLRSRPADRVSERFAARLAARLDDASGWFGVADWRAWTLRLTPVAALLAAFVLLGSSPPDTALTLDDWTLDVDDSSSTATLLLQSDVNPDVGLDALIESIVVGDDGAGSGGTGDVGK